MATQNWNLFFNAEPNKYDLFPNTDTNNKSFSFTKDRYELQLQTLDSNFKSNLSCQTTFERKYNAKRILIIFSFSENESRKRKVNIEESEDEDGDESSGEELESNVMWKRESFFPNCVPFFLFQEQLSLDDLQNNEGESMDECLDLVESGNKDEIEAESSPLAEFEKEVNKWWS